MKPSTYPTPRRERGLALLSALLLMLVALMAGIAVGRTVSASVAAARYERERLVARGAAEAALLDAERDIAAGADLVRAGLFSTAGAASWPAACGHGAHDRGLCGVHDPPAWQTLDLAAPGNAALVRYGELTGAPIATGGAQLPARSPAYLIERLAAPAGVFRITAVGFGTRATTLAVLQALYHKPDLGKPDPAAPPSTLPPGRIGTREIANWPELHAQAQP